MQAPYRNRMASTVDCTTGRSCSRSGCIESRCPVDYSYIKVEKGIGQSLYPEQSTGYSRQGAAPCLGTTVFLALSRGSRPRGDKLFGCIIFPLCMKLTEDSFVDSLLSRKSTSAEHCAARGHIARVISDPFDRSLIVRVCIFHAAIS